MKTIVGIFKDYRDAESSIADLTRLGLTASDVGLLAAPNGRSRPAMNQTDLPDLGRVTANAPMLAFLDNQRVRSDPAGVFGMLLRMGIPSDDANGYLDGIRRGAVFEAFDVPDDKVADALAIMRRHSKSDGSERRFEAEGSKQRELAEERELVIPILSEELYVGKREVASGVRVDTHVTAEPVERTISLIEERIDVERRKVDRLIDGEPDAFAERTLEMKAIAEEPYVTKRARVVEEVRIHKDRKERTENIRDTLRHTEVDVTESADEAPGAKLDPSRYTEHFKRIYEPQNIEFERVAPAYAFGERLRRRFSHGDWSSIEGNVGSRWERHNPGTWERFKEAVRAGWESVGRR